MTILHSARTDRYKVSQNVLFQQISSGNLLMLVIVHDVHEMSKSLKEKTRKIPTICQNRAETLSSQDVGLPRVRLAMHHTLLHTSTPTIHCLQHIQFKTTLLH